MTKIILDIETIPSQLPGAREQILASIKPPGTLKKAESIAAWWENESEIALGDAYRKQALDGGTFGEIVSIAMVAPDDDSDPGWSFCRAAHESEGTLLIRFIDEVVKRLDAEAAKSSGSEHNFAVDPFFIAHNAAFDLPFIWRRLLVNRIRPSFKFPRPASREGRDFACTMTIWAGFNGKISLDALCRALSVPSPKDGGIDGSQVFDAWRAGEHERIAAYNLRDVMATAAVWHRLQGGRA